MDRHRGWKTKFTMIQSAYFFPWVKKRWDPCGVETCISAACAFWHGLCFKSPCIHIMYDHISTFLDCSIPRGPANFVAREVKFPRLGFSLFWRQLHLSSLIARKKNIHHTPKLASTLPLPQALLALPITQGYHATNGPTMQKMHGYTYLKEKSRFPFFKYKKCS